MLQHVQYYTYQIKSILLKRNEKIMNDRNAKNILIDYDNNYILIDDDDFINIIYKSIIENKIDFLIKNIDDIFNFLMIDDDVETFNAILNIIKNHNHLLN